MVCAWMMQELRLALEPGFAQVVDGLWDDGRANRLKLAEHAAGELQLWGQFGQLSAEEDWLADAADRAAKHVEGELERAAKVKAADERAADPEAA